MVELKGFQGDSNWIHVREGHAGKVYWPGGASGVTLDPGFDLGYNTSTDLYRYYTTTLNTDELQRLEHSVGIKGNLARNIIVSRKYDDIRISREEAEKIFPNLLEPYWNALIHIWPEILEGGKAVHTAMLSLVYNRGVGNNKVILALNSLIREKDWIEVGYAIKNMQQDHPLKGIRKRRRMEGELILKEKGRSKWHIPNLKKVPVIGIKNQVPDTHHLPIQK